MSSAEGNTLPDGWEEKTLSEVCDVRDGTHDSPKYIDKGFPLITSKNLKNGHLNFEKIKYISEADYNSINKRSKVDVGDILFAMIGTIGNPVLIKNQPNYAIKNVALFKKKSNDVLMTFLKYFLVNPIVIDKMTNEAKGATQKFVGLNYLRSFKITIPPLKEQKRIVAKIDTLFAKIDKAISLTEESLKQAKNLLPSILKEVFEKGKADGWEEKKWDEVLEIKNGKSQKEFLVDDGGYPIYGSGGLMNGRVSKFLCPKNTTIVGRKGTIDKPKYIEEDFWNVDTAFGLCSKTGLNPRFLYYFCLTFNFRSLNKSTTLPSLTKRDLLQIRMPITTSENQMKVVRIADDILLKSQKTQSKLEEQLAYLKQLKSSILGKAFKGEL